MTNHSFKYLVAFAIVILLISGCKKKQPDAPVVVSFSTPDENAVFYVPDTILVRFSIESGSKIRSISASIDNTDMVPLSEQVYIYPEVNQQQFEVALPVNAMANADSVKCFVHLMVENEQKTTNAFRYIHLNNKSFTFKGFSVVTEEELNNSTLYFFDENFNATGAYPISGRITHTSTAQETDLLFLTSAIPDLLMAYRFSDHQPEWTREPQLPYPEFTFVQYQEPFLYFGNGAGQVISVYGSDGTQVFNTPLFDNFYPTGMAVNSTKLVIGYKSRSGLSSRLTTCYRTTGSLVQEYLTDFNLVFGRKSNESEEVILFGNTNNVGNRVIFDPEANEIVSTQSFNIGSIKQAISIDGQNFLVNSASGLFRIDSNSAEAEQVYIPENEMMDVVYDPYLSRLLIGDGSRVLIFSYPGLDLIKQLEFNNQVLSITTRYNR
ncbi:MAG: hypothetical protein WC341_10055 [Bacteroidales bacterium]|jgi:outer membrane protein assembly factor BamB